MNKKASPTDNALGDGCFGYRCKKICYFSLFQPILYLILPKIAP
ncbi:hypothetical protein [Hugenholtzia roseola]|nr:hypothetical protein [Hugenholtzia roseola]